MTPTLVAAVRQTLDDGVHTIADTVRNSLNFYRMQDSAETVDRAVLTGPAVAIPGFAARLSEQLQIPVEGDRRRRPVRQRRPRPSDSRRRAGARRRRPSSGRAT